MERRNQARGANEWNDTYGSMGMAPQAQLTQLPLHILDPWRSDDDRPQPFKPYSKAKLQRLAESIRENGVIEPICARPMPNGRFQIIAGHNRVEASKLVGLTTVPVLVQQLDYQKAHKLMIDSNFQHRETILPSEKARAYYELIKNMRHRGQRTDLTSGNHCPKSDIEGAGNETLDNDCPKLESAWSHQVIADEYGVSASSVKQHLRLLNLKSEWLDMVDNGATEKVEQDPNLFSVTFVAGYEISFLPETEQDMLLSVVFDLGKPPTPAQAKQLHKSSKASPLGEAAILAILKPEKASNAPASIKLPSARISSFFPPNTSVEDMEREIYAALAAYRKNDTTPASL